MFSQFPSHYGATTFLRPVTPGLLNVRGLVRLASPQASSPPPLFENRKKSLDVSGVDRTNLVDVQP